MHPNWPVWVHFCAYLDMAARVCTKFGPPVAHPCPRSGGFPGSRLCVLVRCGQPPTSRVPAPDSGGLVGSFSSRRPRVRRTEVLRRTAYGPVSLRDTNAAPERTLRELNDPGGPRWRLRG